MQHSWGGEKIKAIAKRILYATGVAHLLRRVLHRRTLTVLVLHRVLPDDDPRAATADWNYTVRLETFRAFTRFLSRAYHVVSLKDVERAFQDGVRLPPRALLITFDDAWDDTARYAAPLLESCGIPSALFVPTAALGCDSVLWRDAVAALWRAECLNRGDVKNVMPESLDARLTAFQTLSLENRKLRLDQALAEAGPAVVPMMMTRDDLRRLPRSVDIGGHGVNHLAFSSLESVDAELIGCKSALRELTGRTPRSFAFPFGDHKPHHLDLVRQAGYLLVFTSDRVVNWLGGGPGLSPVFGRIAVNETDLTDRDGRFCPAQVAFWLALQRVRRLDRHDRDGNAGAAAKY